MSCPCGSNEQFKNCCLAVVKGHKKAKSPEQLMRSRFSAYVLNDAQYIFDSYSQHSQASQSVSDIKDWASTCKFVELTIHHISTLNEYNSDDPSDLPTVEFTACYLIANKLYQISEKSRFIKEPISNNSTNGMHWAYLDGDVYQHTEVGIIKRNDLCPCAINKARDIKQKFKRCCGQ
jgi:SEC-C motif-containing protein